MNRFRPFFIVLLCGLVTIGACSSTLQGLRVKIGDTLSIHIFGIAPPHQTAPSGDTVSGSSSQAPEDLRYAVFTDGTIDSHEFGLLHVAGLTIPEITKLIRARLAQKYKNPIVSVVLDSEASDLVYLSGTRGSDGEAKILPGMDLRRLLASTALSDAPDQSEVHFFRTGLPDRVALTQDILTGQSPMATLKLKNDDVVTILPLAFIRVWVTGDVIHPGQVSVPKGSDLYIALAQAGGTTPVPLVDSNPRVSLRRGPEVRSYPMKQDPSAAPIALEAGDSIVVSTGTHIAVTVTGEVKTTGLQQLPSTAVLDQAIAAAGGLSASGTGRGVTILRRGQTLKAGVASSTDPVGLGSFKLQDQDVVLVNQNTQFVIAVGFVRTQGRIYIPDGQPLHLIDAIALTGGIVDRGTPRHVFVGHPDSKGRMNIKEYRLDRYLKDGDPAGNPLLTAGDVITVQPAADTALNAVNQVLTGAILLFGVSKL